MCVPEKLSSCLVCLSWRSHKQLRWMYIQRIRQHPQQQSKTHLSNLSEVSPFWEWFGIGPRIIRNNWTKHAENEMTGRPVGLHRAFNPIVGQFPHYMGVNPKNRGDFTTKMDGENFHGKPDEQMDDLGGFVPIFLG